MIYFIYRLCYSQTDQSNLIVRALTRKEADAKMDKVIKTTGAHHYDFIATVSSPII